MLVLYPTQRLLHKLVEIPAPKISRANIQEVDCQERLSGQHFYQEVSIVKCAARAALLITSTSKADDLLHFISLSFNIELIVDFASF